MKKVLFREVQYLHMLTIILLVTAVLMLLATFFRWGTHPIPLYLGIIVTVVIALPIVSFYKLETVITSEDALVVFGKGPFKRKLALDQLDAASAEIVNTSWATGVGYRFTSRGTLFNAKPGKAVYVKTKDGHSEFFVGTRKPEQLLSVFKDLEIALLRKL